MNLTKLELALRDREAELYQLQDRAPTREAEQRLVMRRELLWDLIYVLVKYEARCREESLG